MKSVWTWAKENYDLISLILGLIGVYISVIPLMYELRKRKREKMKELKEKQEKQVSPNSTANETDNNAG